MPAMRGMMPELYRIRVKRPDLEVEVESTNREYVEEKLDHYLTPKGPAVITPAEKHVEPRGSSGRPISIREFVKQVNPDKKNEVAATIAYLLEFHTEPMREEWRPDEVADKFADVRKLKPANMTDLLKKSNFFMEGREKGSYRLSETGVNWVEGRLNDNAG
jgi:hypothetical protein